MRGKKAPLWVTPFLRALERTGKARAAAVDAGVDFSTAYARRRAHADFAADWAGALERFGAGKDRARKAEMAETVERVRKGRVVSPLGSSPFAPSPGSPAASPTAAGSHHPPAGALPGAPAEGGGVPEELVIRPSVTGSPKLVKASAGRWSRKREEIFLAELAASANVRRASEAAGLSRNAFLARRRKDPHFAAAWDAVVEMARVEARSFLAESMTRTFDPLALPDPESSPMPRVSIAEAIKIAEMKGPATAAGSDAYDMEEVRRALEKKMRVLGMLDEDEERRADGWTEVDGQWIPPGWGETAAIGLSGDAGAPALARTCVHCGQRLYLTVERGGKDGIIDRTPDSGRRTELD
jgi:hypothetical protein